MLDKIKKAYQSKLNKFNNSLTPGELHPDGRPKFNPIIFAKRQQQRADFWASLSDDEKILHNLQKDVIV